MENDKEVVIDLEEEENDEEKEKAEESDEEKSDQSDELKKAQDEAAKWRRIAEKNAKKQEAPKEKEKIIQTGLSKEETELVVLASQGYTTEQLEELKVLSKARGKSPMETVSDPIFVKMKEQWEADAKAQKAKLGASKGSGQVKKEKSFNSPELSEEEHKEMWKANRDR